MLHAKPLLLVNDQKTKIFKFQIIRQYTVRSDHDINHPFAHIFDRLPLLRRCPESAQQIHPHRKVFHPLHKCIVVLLGKHGGRNEIYNLLALLHCLKCSADCNLCLSISDIAADQSVHDLLALHIFFRGLYRIQLVFRLLKWEHLFKLPLPDRIFPVYIPFFFLPCGIKFYKFLRDLFYRAADPRLRLCPFLTAKFI